MNMQASIIKIAEEMATKYEGQDVVFGPVQEFEDGFNYLMTIFTPKGTDTPISHNVQMRDMTFQQCIAARELIYSQLGRYHTGNFFRCDNIYSCMKLCHILYPDNPDFKFMNEKLTKLRSQTVEAELEKLANDSEES